MRAIVATFAMSSLLYGCIRIAQPPTFQPREEQRAICRISQERCLQLLSKAESELASCDTYCNDHRMNIAFIRIMTDEWETKKRREAREAEREQYEEQSAAEVKIALDKADKEQQQKEQERARLATQTLENREANCTLSRAARDKEWETAYTEAQNWEKAVEWIKKHCKHNDHIVESDAYIAKDEAGYLYEEPARHARYNLWECPKKAPYGIHTTVANAWLESRPSGKPWMVSSVYGGDAACKEFDIKARQADPSLKEYPGRYEPRQ